MTFLTGPTAVTALLLTAVLLAACDNADNAGNEADRTTPPSTGPTTVSTTEPQDTKHTLAELVDDPCRVLSAEATAALDVPLDNENDFNGKTCQWHMAAGAVDFKPVPAADLAADPANQQKMTATQVGGHPALLSPRFAAAIVDSLR